MRGGADSAEEIGAVYARAGAGAAAANGAGAAAVNCDGAAPGGIGGGGAGAASGRAQAEHTKEPSIFELPQCGQNMRGDCTSDRTAVCR